MMADIRAGRVDTVVTKDLSRLGRNSARVGDLLDEVFPSLRVRFVAVSEGVDTAAGQGDLLAPLANAVNEWYARDISRKIRAALDVKRRRGEYIGSFAPYGYRKDPGDPHRLVPDEAAARVVRRLFREAADTPASELAERLNREGIPTPLDYRRGEGAHRWTGDGVRKILRNRCYLGWLEQGKSVKVSFKSRTVLYPGREEWLVTEHAHPALVDEETFAAAQRPAPARKGFHNEWAGLLFCADCGSPMVTVGTRRAGSPAALACGAYKAGGAARCRNHRIDYLVLTRALGAVLRETVRLTPEEVRTLSGAVGRPVGEVEALLRFDPPEPWLLRRLIARVAVEQGQIVREEGGAVKHQRLQIDLAFRTPTPVSCVWVSDATPPASPDAGSSTPGGSG